MDNFDIVCNFAYDVDPPISKRHRAESANVERYLRSQDPEVSDLFRLMLEVYRETGFENLRDMRVFRQAYFTDAGWNAKRVQRVFGSKKAYLEALDTLENALYEKED